MNLDSSLLMADAGYVLGDLVAPTIARIEVEQVRSESAKQTRWNPNWSDEEPVADRV